MISVVGSNGAGKSTLSKVIAGFEKPSSGEIYIGDKLVSSEKQFLPPEKRGIGMVFQSYAVWPHMNVFDNIAYPLKIQKINKNEIEERVNQVLKIVHLEQYKDRFPSELSGGQQRRVALARAVISKPKLLLLDEPFTGSDKEIKLEIMNLVRIIREKYNTSIIFVTHDLSEAEYLEAKCIEFKKGESL